MDDIFKIQDEIATSVATALNVALSNEGRTTIVGTTSFEAYSLYHQAISLARTANSPPEYETTLQYIRDAINTDPGYSDAWALLVATYDSEAEERFGSVPLLRKEAKRAAQHALELGPQQVNSHLAIARVLLNDWDFVGAEMHARQALALDPGSSFALGWAGDIAGVLGRTEEALNLRYQGRYRGRAA